MQVKIFYDKIGNIVYHTTGDKDIYNDLPHIFLDITEDQYKNIKKHYILLSNLSLVKKYNYYYIYNESGDIINSYEGGLCQASLFIPSETKITSTDIKRVVNGEIVSKTETEIADLESARNAQIIESKKSAAVRLLIDTYVLSKIKDDPQTPAKILTKVTNVFDQKKAELQTILQGI